MEEQDEGPDTSSIKPISSLRSRFESLGQISDTRIISPVAQRHASLGLPSPAVKDRSPSPSGFRRSPSPNPAISDDISFARPRPRHRTPSIGRPQSMAAPRSPPLVTVDSPSSPTRKASIDFHVNGGRSPVQPRALSADANSPSTGHVRSLSRTMTPSLDARSPSQPLSTDPAKQEPEQVPVPDWKSKPSVTTANVRPPVNRAGKPQIPKKPTSLGKSSSNGLTAPDHTAELTDQSISPFSTPPSSESGSPAPRNRQNSDAIKRVRNDSDATNIERLRGDSTSSAQGRFRADSNASWVERLRGDSNASSVEPSSLPTDHFQAPPVHHVVAAKREQQAFSLGRTSTMPARYKPESIDERSAAGDLPEERPRLPLRPDLQSRFGRGSPPKPHSGRTSPTKLRPGRTSPVRALQVISSRSSVDTTRPSMRDLDGTQQRIPAVQPSKKSALSQGFGRPATPPASVPVQHANPVAPTSIPAQHVIPAVPAPRRSAESRRKAPSPPRPNGGVYDDSHDEAPQVNGHAVGPGDFPDSSQANRRPPRYKQRPWQIPTEYETRLLAVCGDFVVTSGYFTKAWSLRTGEQLLNMEHNDNVKISSMAFKSAANVEDEGKRIWLGSSIGEIHEVDILNQTIIKTKSGAHTRRDIFRMFRYGSQMWSLDDGGELNVWLPDKTGLPSLDVQCNTFRVPRGHTFSMAHGDKLWIATGKEIRVFKPGALADTEFHVLRQPLTQPNTGDVTSGTVLVGQADHVYLGHSDGKVSIYNSRDYNCVSVVNVSLYKISTLIGVGNHLWAGYNTGMAYVYDVSTTPWTVKKDWQAHEKAICGMIVDPSATWKMERLNVLSLGTDNMLRIWDGLLGEDWLEGQMQTHDSEYCSFRELTAAVLTWNAGAAKPTHLQYTKQDNDFFQEYLTAYESPDIFVFGFQELVDLEDKKVTAKSFFKSKKRDPTEPEHMSHAYRAWRDHITRCIEEFVPSKQGYSLLHTASMVGLFTCVFVKSSLRGNIQHVHTAEVKRGMGGLHGNKGALIMRFVIDDSSVCLLNCHLAAGQTQTINRNNDIAAILESEALPAYPLSQSSQAQHSDVFSSGGDGSMILDHEICVLNGDLNYRIDTMGRDTVVKHVAKGDLARLLDRDQLLLSRKKNPGFRLRAFRENAIRFAPTYKYNVQSDEYDTSEKRRAPAWCDRILYRGLGKVRCEEYRRWEVRISDHRPVSSLLRLRIKTVDHGRRGSVWQKCLDEFETEKKRVARAVQLEYLINTYGMTPTEAAAAMH